MSICIRIPETAAETIFDATKEAGVRALVSVGWVVIASKFLLSHKTESIQGGLGNTAVPPHIYMLGNVPHDWLFDNERVAAVVHHGGAGTTAIGLAKGRPTVVVPFFGDQSFWGQFTLPSLFIKNSHLRLYIGNMIYKAGAGPKPIPPKELKVKKLRDAIKFVTSPQAKEAATKLGEKIRKEVGLASITTLLSPC